jgi:hypothetical protein
MAELPADRLCADGWISTYLKYSQQQASPPLFHLWTAISVVSGVLKRNTWIDRGGYFNLYPNLYVVLIAPTGRCKKSTAARMGVKVMQSIDGIKITHEKLTPEGLIAHLGEVGGGITTTVASDGKNVRIGPKHDSTCYVFAPELSVFIGSASYVNGLIEVLTTLYECPDEWEYKTRTKGTIHLNNVCINLIGATNPEWMAKGFSEDSFGGGFMGRIIFIFQDSRRKVAWITKAPDADDLKIKLLHDLVKISEMKGTFAISDGAYEYYEKWHDAFEGDFSGRMAGYFERKPDHILKLAMILSASTSDNMVITKDHIEAAINMLSTVEELMPKAFSYVGATPEARIAYHVIDIIANSPQHFISYKRLLNTIQHMIKNRKELEEVVDLLESAGQIRQLNRAGKRYFTLDEDIKEYLSVVEKMAEDEARVEMEKVKQEQKEQKEEKPGSIKEVVEQVLVGTKVQ